MVLLDLELGLPEIVEEWLVDLVSSDATVWMTDSLRSPGDAPGGRHPVDIPVTFDGPDLDEVAASIGCSTTSVIDQLVGADLKVAFLGFAPGFPFLVGLPPELASNPRRPTPRTSVPAGSIALGGGFAAVYPQATPGGWMLLGRTTVRLFDPDNPPHTLVRAGDTVRFSISPGPNRARGSDSSPAPSIHPTPGGPTPDPLRPGQPIDTASPRRPPMRARGNRFVEVLDPGLLSLVEDGGRRSVAGMGVPGAGAADPDAMRLANRLVGNPDAAATIEVTAVGPRLRFTGDAHLAVVASSADGVAMFLDGRPVGTNTVSPIQDGQVATIGPITVGLRAYVAVAGGLETPLVLGSRSSDMLCGLGPGPLITGDQLDLGRPTRPHGLLSEPLEPAPATAPTVIRVVGGPHHVPRLPRDGLTSVVWTVGDASNRIGIRLKAADRPPAPDVPAILSTAMVNGAIQFPPDGDPIILMPDHATVGGYPVIACVIAADLAKLGQLRPGDTLRFVSVDRRTARTEYLRRERVLSGLVSGWFPTEAAT